MAWSIVNVGHPEGSTTLEKVLGATMRAAFGDDAVWRDPVERTNTMLLGTTSTDPAARLLALAPTLPPDLALVVSAAATGSPPLWRVVRFTPTTGRPWSGWSTSALPSKPTDRRVVT